MQAVFLHHCDSIVQLLESTLLCWNTGSSNLQPMPVPSTSVLSNLPAATAHGALSTYSKPDD